MTDRQFWAKLDEISRKNNNDTLAVCKLIRKAYDEDRSLICGCIHTGPGIVNQLYKNIYENDPNLPGNRYMLCYTSMRLAYSDDMLNEPVEKLPVRAVVDNALNKKVIGGLVFNHHIADRIMICPKEFLEETTLVKAMQEVYGYKE